MQSLAQQYSNVKSTVAPPSSEYMFHTFDIKPPPPIMSQPKTTDVTMTSSTNAKAASTATSAPTVEEHVRIFKFVLCKQLYTLS